jgi:hypothetical protein
MARHDNEETMATTADTHTATATATAMSTRLVLLVRTLHIARTLLRVTLHGRQRRIRSIGVALTSCLLPTVAIISTPTIASAQTTANTVRVTSPIDGSCATTSTRNLQAAYTGTGTVSYMSYFLNGAWEKQINGTTAPWNWTGNYANGTYTTVAKATLTTGTVITSPPITWKRLTTCPAVTTTTTTTTVAPPPTTTTTTTVAPTTTTTTTPNGGIPAVRGIRILSPLNNACHQTSTWTFQAQITGDLTTTSVNYILDGTWEGQATTAPWTYTNNYTYGTHTLTAQATLSNGTTVTSPATTFKRDASCTYEPTTTTTTTTTTLPPNEVVPNIQTPLHGSCTTNQTVTLTSTSGNHPADTFQSITFDLVGGGIAQTFTVNRPGPYTVTKTLTYDTYTVRARSTFQVYPGYTSNPVTFTIAPTCTPTTTTTTTPPSTTTTTTTTTTTPPPPSGISLTLPNAPVAREILTANISNALPADTVEILDGTGAVVDSYGALSTVRFIAPKSGSYNVRVTRDGNPMSSAALTVLPFPTLSVSSTSDFVEGFPLQVSVTGTLEPTDRLRLDTAGQADDCPTCTDPTLNIAAATNATFPNTPKPGTYEVRLLRRGNTIARKLVTINPIPNVNVELWRNDPQYNVGPFPPIPAGCERYYSRLNQTGIGTAYVAATYDTIVSVADGSITYQLNNPDTERSLPWNLCKADPNTVVSEASTNQPPFQIRISGRTPQLGDYIQVGPNLRVQPNQAFRTGDIAPLGSWKPGATYVTGSYHSLIGGRDTAIGAVTFGFSTYSPTPVCVLSPQRLGLINGNNRIPAGSFHYVIGNACTDQYPIVMYTTDAQGLNETPNQRDIYGNPIPNRYRGNGGNAESGTDAPDTPFVQPPPTGTHFFDEAVLTPLEGADDLGCITRSGTTLTYGNANQGCVEVIPLKNDSPANTWQLWLPAYEGCLAQFGSQLTISTVCDPTVEAVNFLDEPKVGLRFGLKTSTTGQCLTHTATTVGFEPCELTEGPRMATQRWYDATKKAPPTTTTPSTKPTAGDKACTEALGKADKTEAGIPESCKNSPGLLYNAVTATVCEKVKTNKIRTQCLVTQAMLTNTPTPKNATIGNEPLRETFYVYVANECLKNKKTACSGYIEAVPMFSGIETKEEGQTDGQIATQIATQFDIVTEMQEIANLYNTTSSTPTLKSQLLNEDARWSLEEQATEYVTRKRCGISNTCLTTGTNTVYYATTGTGNTLKVTYIGITNNFTRRAQQHKNGPAKRDIFLFDAFKVGTTTGGNLSPFDARSVEQVLIELYGGPKGPTTAQLDNTINSVSKNPTNRYGRFKTRGCQIISERGKLVGTGGANFQNPQSPTATPVTFADVCPNVP